MWRNFVLTGLILGLSAAVMYVAIFNLDPLGEQKIIAFLAFFMSAFLGIASFFTFVFFFASELISGKKLGVRYFLIAVRRGIMVAAFFVGALLLQALGLLGLLELILWAAFVAILEWVFSGSTSRPEIGGAKSD